MTSCALGIAVAERSLSVQAASRSTVRDGHKPVLGLFVSQGDHDTVILSDVQALVRDCRG